MGPAGAGTRYRITFDNTGDTVERDGFALQRDGIEICLESALTSELVVIDSV